MMSSGMTKHLTLASAVVYQIKVQGWLDENWSDRLAGMRIEIYMPKDRKPEAVLVGQLHDQSELLGVLNSLYELRLPILSVDIMENNNHDQPEVKIKHECDNL